MELPKHIVDDFKDMEKSEKIADEENKKKNKFVQNGLSYDRHRHHEDVITIQNAFKNVEGWDIDYREAAGTNFMYSDTMAAGWLGIDGINEKDLVRMLEPYLNTCVYKEELKEVVQEILEMDNIEEIKDKLKELAKSKFIKL